MKVMRVISLCAAAGIVALAVFAPNAGSARDTSAEDACKIERNGLTSGPSADICAQIVRRWRVLMGDRAALVPGVVRIVDGFATRSSWGRLEWTLEWPASEGSYAVGAQPKRRDGLIPDDAVNVVPHEAGHHLFSSAFDLTPIRGLYSTPAPDWFDESPAIWMESRVARTRRMSFVRGSRPSLERVATIPNPSAEFGRRASHGTDFRPRKRVVIPPCDRCTWRPDSLRKKYEVTEIGVNAQGQPDTVVTYTDQDPGRETFEQKQFYPLAYSLLRFIRLRGGPAAIRELMSRYHADPRPRLSALAGLPGLPATTAAFEAAWHAFLANPPPEDQ